MPTIRIGPSFENSNVNWTPLFGTLTAAVSVEGSGNYAYNFTGFNSGMSFFLDCTAIPAGSTIHSVTAVCNVQGSAMVGSPSINALELAAAPGTASSGRQFVTGSWSEIDLIYPYALTLAELQAALISLGADGASGSIQCDFLGADVNYDPPAQPATMVWTSPPWAVECGVPPMKLFKPFLFVPKGTASPDDVSVYWTFYYGAVPPGYQVFLISRSVGDNFEPNANSPLVIQVMPSD